MLGGNQLEGFGKHDKKRGSPKGRYFALCFYICFPISVRNAESPHSRVQRRGVHSQKPSGPCWALDPPVSLRENGNNVLAFRFFKCRRGNITGACRHIEV